MIANETGKKLQLGQLLIQAGALTEEQLTEALAEQKQGSNRLLLGEVLVKLDFCTEEQIMQSLATGYDCPMSR